MPSPHNPDCPVPGDQLSSSFIQEEPYLLPGVTTGIPALNLEAAHAHRKQAFWYLDNRYLGETVNKHQLSLVPEPGWHRLLVIDGWGNSREINFYLERR